MSDIKQKYLSTLDDLEHITGTAMTLSLETQNREVDSRRKQYCSYIFGKLIMHAIAVLLVRPNIERQLDKYESDLWDISSLATLTRAIVDSYYVFFYLGLDQASEDELEFRFHLWDYHGEKQRFDMLKKLKSLDPSMGKLENEVGDLKNKVIQNTFYQSLDPTKQRKIKKGEIAILYSNSELSDRLGINSDYYKAIYNDLSAYIHGYPYALTQLAVFRSNDDESLHVINTTLKVCVGYVSLAVRDFLEIMPDQDNNVDERAKDLIETWDYVFKNIIEDS